MRIPLLTSVSGIRHTWVQEADDWRIESEQDTAPIIDQAKAMNTENDGYSPSRDLRRVATIPFAVALKWKNEEGWDCFDPDNADKLMRKLNSNEYAYLRTAPGRLGVSNGVMR